MKRIELAQDITFQEAKLKAATLMLHDPAVNSVRVVVKKDTHKMWIEYTTFPQNNRNL